MRSSLFLLSPEPQILSELNLNVSSRERFNMHFQVIIEFAEIKMIEINVDSPQNAAKAALKLINEGKLKPQINEIAIFDIEDDLGFEPPIFVLNP